MLGLQLKFPCVKSLLVVALGYVGAFRTSSKVSARRFHDDDSSELHLDADSYTTDIVEDEFEDTVGQSYSGSLEDTTDGSKFRCPRECKQCCMSDSEKPQFECHLKGLFARMAPSLKELAGKKCHHNENMNRDGVVITVCDLGDIQSDSSVDFETQKKRLDNQIQELDVKLESVAGKVAEEEAAAELITKEAAEVDRETQVLKDAKAGSEKAFGEIKSEIVTLEKELLRGAKRPVPEKESLMQIAGSSPECKPVSDIWVEIIKRKTAEIQRKQGELNESTEAIDNAKLQKKNAQLELEKAKHAKKTLEEDKELQPILAQIDSLRSRRKRLQTLIDKGFSTVRYHLTQLQIATIRNSDMVHLLFRLLESESGAAGPDRQKAFQTYVAPDAGTTIKDDNARLLSFCARRKQGDPSFSCSSDAVTAYFKTLRKEVKSLISLYESQVDLFLADDESFDQSAILDKLPYVKEKCAELGEMITSWQKEDPPRFNEPLWMDYLNWVEDSESAVRVYIKVTNREIQANKPSNSLLTCAEQRHDLPYIPDRLVRISDCLNTPPWETQWPSTEAACSNHDEWDENNADRTFGPFFGVYSSSDESGKRAMENNIPNKKVYGKNKEVVDSFDWAPHMRSVLRQARSGYTIVLFGYGYSGTGKTYTLLGKGPTPGVLTLGLQEMQDCLKGISVRFKELYGQMDLTSGHPVMGETGIFSYKIELSPDTGMPIPSGQMCPNGKGGKCVEYDFWGREDNRDVDISHFKPEDVKQPENFTGFLEKEDHITPININKVRDNGYSIGEWIQQALELVQETRLNMGCRVKTKQKHQKVCQHIRATPNNPESSRGHLFTILDVHFKAHEDDEDQSDKLGKLVIVDCAGSEEPASIMRDYVDFAADDSKRAGVASIKISEMRASQYLKMYDRKIGARNMAFWNNRKFDYVVSGVKMETWQVAAAEQWLRSSGNYAVPQDYIQKFGLTASKRDKRLFRTEGSRNDALRGVWSGEYLLKQGIIATVKEGVFINEGLNHLKQFLLRRAGKIKSVVQILSPGKTELLGDPNTQVPGVIVTAPGSNVSKPLPVLNTWDRDAADVSPYVGSFEASRPNPKYDPVPSYYHPKQFIKPWNYRELTRSRRKKKVFAENTDSLVSSARCAFGWPTRGADPVDPDFSCDDVIVDGIKLGNHGRASLNKGEIARFDPMLMTSMLNYFDHPEDFGKQANIKPTKFLMMAAVRREHPEQESIPSGTHAQDTTSGFKRHKYNICKGAEATLQFADEMNPLSRRFQ